MMIVSFSFSFFLKLFYPNRFFFVTDTMSFTRSCASDGFWLLHGQVADNQMFEFRNRKNKRPEDVMVEGLFLFVGLQKLWQYKKLAESCAVGIQLPAVSCAMTTTMV